MRYDLEWNPDTAHRNLSQYGITFEQAASVFKDPVAFTLYDVKADSTIPCWITLSRASGKQYLAITHTFRTKSDDTAAIEIMSAKAATPDEIKQYQGARSAEEYYSSSGKRGKFYRHNIKMELPA